MLGTFRFVGWDFVCLISDISCMLRDGPASSADKAGFFSWLYNFDTELLEDWLILGDFNFIRSPENRNRPEGNPTEMLLFNDLINHLYLLEIELQGQAFTWSNM
jgi:hypothetical protein